MRLLFLVSVLLCKAAWAQSSLLWEITGPNLTKPSYLYGTIHLKDSRVFEFGDSVLAKFDRCEAIVLELIEDEESIKSAMYAMFLPAGDSLKNHMKSRDYKILMDYAMVNMGPAAARTMDVMKPIFISVLLAESYAESTEPLPLDMFLQEKGNEAGKIMIALESLKEQIEAIDAIKMKHQVKMLMDQITDEEGIKESMTSLVLAYQQQDLAAVAKVMGDSKMPNYVSKALIVDRNRVMAERVDSLIQLNSSFVAVGAGHLPNKEGLINLLRQRGYRVEAVISKYTPGTKERINFENWQEIRSETSKFKIRMPAIPNASTSFTETEFGAVEYQLWIHEDQQKGYVFSVSSMILPKLQITNDEGRYLEKSVDRLAQTTGSSVVSSSRIDHDGLEVIEAEFQSMPQYHFRVRVYLKGLHTYTVMIGGAPSMIRGEIGDYYMKSFELLP